MSEKLIVKDFAGIKEITLEIKKINILIGTQVSGKSVCIKLFFYFKTLLWRILDVINDSQIRGDRHLNDISTFERYFPPDTWGNYDFFIRYETVDISIEVRRRHGSRTKISISYSDSFKAKFSLLRLREKWIREKIFNNDNLRSQGFDKKQDILRNLLIKFLSESFGKEVTFEQVFIPAGRSFISRLQTSALYILCNDNSFDPFLGTFGLYYDNIRSTSSQSEDCIDRRKNIRNEITNLTEELLHGKYVHKKGKDFILHKDGRYIDIINASSGQQEILPLIIILTRLIDLSSPKTIYIEEPETHLFPSLQRNVIELIATVFNCCEDNIQLFITTHSEYILTVINDLLQAGNLYEYADQEILVKLHRIVPRYKVIDIDDLSAYRLNGDKCSSIICTDTRSINTSIIDPDSNKLAVELKNLSGGSSPMESLLKWCSSRC